MCAVQTFTLARTKVINCAENHKKSAHMKYFIRVDNLIMTT